MDDIYREQILDHYKHPHHAGVLDKFTVTERELNPLCGDDITLYLLVENGKVKGNEARMSDDRKRSEYQKQVIYVSIKNWAFDVSNDVFIKEGEEAKKIISRDFSKISVVIDEKYLELGVRALHAAFELDKAPIEEFYPMP